MNMQLESPIQDEGGLRSIRQVSAAQRDAIRRLCVTNRELQERTASGSESPENARLMVRQLLSSLAPPLQVTPTLSGDLATVRKTIASVEEAVEEEILTQDEADSVVMAVIHQFIERRFDQIMKDVFTPSKSSWFVLTSSSGYSYGSRANPFADTKSEIA